MIIFIIAAMVFTLIMGDDISTWFIGNTDLLENVSEDTEVAGSSIPTVLYDDEDSDVTFYDQLGDEEIQTPKSILTIDVSEDLIVDEVERLNSLLYNNGELLSDLILDYEISVESSLEDSINVVTYGTPYKIDSYMYNGMGELIVTYRLMNVCANYIINAYDGYCEIELTSVSPILSLFELQDYLDERCADLNNLRIPVDTITLDNFSQFSIDMFNYATSIKIWDSTEGRTPDEIFGRSYDGYGIIVGYSINGVTNYVYGIPINGVLVFDW